MSREHGLSHPLVSYRRCTGRPRVHHQRATPVQFFVSPKELNAIKTAAAVAGVPMSGLAKRLVLNTLDPIAEQ